MYEKIAALIARNDFVTAEKLLKKHNVSLTQEQKDAAVRNSTDYYNKNAKPGSLASKANMVKQYNEKNNRK